MYRGKYLGGAGGEAAGRDGEPDGVEKGVLE